MRRITVLGNKMAILTKICIRAPGKNSTVMGNLLKRGAKTQSWVPPLGDRHLKRNLF